MEAESCLPGEEWRTRAECLNHDPSTFFPERGGSTAEARSICAGCPVSTQCLDYALHNRLLIGIWAGTSGRERRRTHSQMASEERRARMEARRDAEKVA